MKKLSKTDKSGIIRNFVRDWDNSTCRIIFSEYDYDSIIIFNTYNKRGIIEIMDNDNDDKIKNASHEMLDYLIQQCDAYYNGKIEMPKEY